MAVRTNRKAGRRVRRPCVKVLVAVLALKVAVVAGMIACARRNYCIRRAAVVPIPAPSLRPAKEATGVVEAGVGTDTLTWAHPPKKLEGRNVGLYVPREQMAGYLLFSPHRAFSLGASWEYGFGYGAAPISQNLIDPPNRGVGGAGLSFSVHYKIKKRFILEWGCDLWGYSIPSRVAYYESDQCTGLPPPNTWPSKIKSSAVFIGRTHLALGIKFRWSHLTLSFGVRNHPHNVDYSFEAHFDEQDITPRLGHAVYPFFNVGWEIRLAPWAFFTAGVYQPLNNDPVIYAPIIGIGIRISEVRRNRRYGYRRRQPPPPDFPPPSEPPAGPPPAVRPLPTPPPAAPAPAVPGKPPATTPPPPPPPRAPPPPPAPPPSS